jgi:hypothetical protein|tara:strand:+ start:156 stop:401 length:246 start_codon:yes stop_codon:yes gene_type:complete
MKLFIQIPCLNEEHTLPYVIAGLPTSIEHVDEMRLLIVFMQVILLIVGSMVPLYRSFVARDHDGSSNPKISRSYLGFVLIS